MRYLLSLFILIAVPALAQEKIYLYPSTEKVTNDGFDKEPPYIEFFKANADSANTTTILIVPGGGYSHLADQHEGVDIARFYNKYGFDAWVLHYRINNGAQEGHRFPNQYNDVTRAIRIVKSKAKDAERVGIIGFSAGGHLSSMCATMHIPAKPKSKEAFERYSSRPSFALLIYPVITLAGKAAHNGSREMLLGKNPENSLVDSLSTYKRVNEFTPPTFIVFSTDDKVVPVENGLLFYGALQKNNIASSMHIYGHGGHGYGMAPKDPVLNTWPKLSVEWLKRGNFVKRSK